MLSSFLDFSRTKITLRRSLWSYSKVQPLYRLVNGLYRLVYEIPDLRYGFAMNVLKKRGTVFCDYISCHNSGIYSNVSTSLEDIITLYRAGIKVNRIDYSAGMNSFKDEIGKDVYPDFFGKSGILDISKELTFNASDVHKIYKQLPLGDLCKAASILFYPSPSVINVTNAMITSSGVVPERSVAICYRGTDKSSEIKAAPVKDYIRVANEILGEGAGHLDIVVLTDQGQVRDEIITNFRGRCRFFNELPVTRGRTAIYNLAFGTAIKMGREEFARRIMAAAIILSRCACVITHTGNVGAWIAIYRGTSKKLYQFDANARLQIP